MPTLPATEASNFHPLPVQNWRFSRQPPPSRSHFITTQATPSAAHSKVQLLAGKTLAPHMQKKIIDSGVSFGVPFELILMSRSGQRPAQSAVGTDRHMDVHCRPWGDASPAKQSTWAMERKRPHRPTRIVIVFGTKNHCTQPPLPPTLYSSSAWENGCVLSRAVKLMSLVCYQWSDGSPFLGRHHVHLKFNLFLPKKSSQRGPF